MSTSAPLRLRQLDGLRGLAAAGVAFGYHSQFLFVPDARPAEWGGPVLGWLDRAGWTLVDLFFLLSGYILAHVYLPGRSLERPQNLAKFALARFARLYPLHLVLLLYTALLFFDREQNTLGAFTHHIFMMQVFVAPPGYTFDGPSWSISVEILCYAIFAAAAFAGGKTLTRVTAILIVGSTILLYRDSTTAWEVGEQIARGTLAFFTGVAMWRHRERLSRVPALVLVSLFMAGILLHVEGRHSALLLTLLAWPATLLLSLRCRHLAARPLLWLGDRSYAVYLIHMPLIDLATRTGARLLGDGIWLWSGAMLGFVVVTLALSDLAYRRLELPARTTLRRRFIRDGGDLAMRLSRPW